MLKVVNCLPAKYFVHQKNPIMVDVHREKQKRAQFQNLPIGDFKIVPTVNLFNPKYRDHPLPESYYGEVLLDKYKKEAVYHLTEKDYLLKEARGFKEMAASISD